MLVSNFVVVSAPGATPSEATSIAVSDNLQLMAVGFESGAVHLYRNMVLCSEDFGRRKQA